MLTELNVDPESSISQDGCRIDSAGDWRNVSTLDAVDVWVKHSIAPICMPLKPVVVGQL